MPEAMIEFDRTENELRDMLVQPTFSLTNGKIKVPVKPGLGVDIDEAYLDKYTIRN